MITKDDIAKYFDMDAFLYARGLSIIEEKRKLGFELEKVLNGRAIIPGQIYIEEFDDYGEETIKYEYNSNEYEFTEILTWDEILDPNTEKKIRDSFSKEIAEAKTVREERNRLRKEQKEAEELAEYERLKAKYDLENYFETYEEIFLKAYPDIAAMVKETKAKCDE